MRLEEQCSAQRTKIIKYEHKFKQMNATIITYTQRKEVLDARLAASNEDNKHLNEKLQTAVEEIERFNADVHELKQKLGGTEARMHELQQEVGRETDFADLEKRAKLIAQMEFISLLRRAEKVRTEIVHLNLHKARWEALVKSKRELEVLLRQTKISENQWRERAVRMKTQLLRSRSEAENLIALLEQEQQKNLSSLQFIIQNLT
eukprot:jgi/Bigna1/78742/fgenesh1_pg.56_\